MPADVHSWNADLDHELGLDPPGRRQLRRGQRTGCRRDGGARAVLSRSLRRASSMPEPTRPAYRERAVGVVVADEQRAEPALEPAVAREPAADDELLAARRPSPCARRRCGVPGRYGAVEALRDHAFEPELGRAREHRVPVAEASPAASARRARRARGARAARAARCRGARTSSGRRARGRRRACTRRAVSTASCARGRRRARVHARLQHLEARHAARRRARRSRRRARRRCRRARSPSARELGEARGRVVACARGRGDAPALDGEERAHAVPLHLERPVLVVGRGRRRGRREHRAEVVRHATARRRARALDGRRWGVTGRGAGAARGRRRAGRRGSPSQAMLRTGFSRPCSRTHPAAALRHVATGTSTGRRRGLIVGIR